MPDPLTYADVRQATNEALESVQGAIRELSHAIADLKASVQGVKNDTGQIGDVHAHATSASRSVMSWQPSLQRIEIYLHQLQQLTGAINSLAQSHANVHQRLDSIEQVTGALSSHLTDVQAHMLTLIKHINPEAVEREVE